MGPVHWGNILVDALVWLCEAFLFLAAIGAARTGAEQAWTLWGIRSTLAIRVVGYSCAALVAAFVAFVSETEFQIKLALFFVLAFGLGIEWFALFDKPSLDENDRKERADDDEEEDEEEEEDEDEDEGEPEGEPEGLGRNFPCTCGSGKKYKHCHGRLR